MHIRAYDGKVARKAARAKIVLAIAARSPRHPNQRIDILREAFVLEEAGEHDWMIGEVRRATCGNSPRHRAPKPVGELSSPATGRYSRRTP